MQPILGDKNVWQRQDVLGQVIDIGIEQLGAGNGYTCKLPPGTLLLDVGWDTVTAFDSGTTATGTVSDGTTTFVNAQDIKSTGIETEANTPKFYPTGGTLTFSAAQTGTPAANGRAIAWFRYMQLGRLVEVQG